MPLMRSFWLCKKPKRKRALRPSVVRRDSTPPTVAFEIFEPKAEGDVHGGTVNRAKATCLCCGAVLPPARVRFQLSEQRGGADAIFDDGGERIGGARMTAVVTLKPGMAGRHYRLPTDADYAAVCIAQSRLADVLSEWENSGKQGLCPVPDEEISQNEIRRISVPIYGMTTWRDLFTARQNLTLSELCSLSSARRGEVKQTLAIAIDKVADLGNALAPWKPDAECPVHLLARQAIGMAWDFCESVPPCDASGSFLSAAERSADALDSVSGIDLESATVEMADAAEQPLPDRAVDVWFTDPPYYDAVPYAHLSDFFFVWLKRMKLERTFWDSAVPDRLTPKNAEIVVDRPHRLSKSRKTPATYEASIARAFEDGRRVLREDGVGSVVFAHKTTEGWEALLSGVIGGGLTVTGSWPVATEMDSRLNARETASLATSVHLICRPRPRDAPIGDWADVLRELPKRVADWMQRLQGEGVRGADLVFACVGPALEIYSRYRAVETVEGREVGLAEYLERVWEVVGRSALRQVLGTTEAGADATLEGALEEDARLTALFLWTLQSTETPATDENAKQDEDEVRKVSAKGFSLPFDVVRRFSQPMGIDLDTWTGRIIAQAKGTVRLLPVAERTKALFGEDGAATAADWIESDANPSRQPSLFPDGDHASIPKPRRRKSILNSDAELQTVDATTLDRLHAAMLLQSSGHASALRTLIAAEQERGPAFLRLANALSALYPRGSQEKRLLDAMLLVVPR